MSNSITFYGFTPVARDPDVLFYAHPTASGEHPKQDLFKVADFPLPESNLAREVKAFAKASLVHLCHGAARRLIGCGNRKSLTNRRLIIATGSMCTVSHVTKYASAT